MLARNRLDTFTLPCTYGITCSKWKKSLTATSLNVTNPLCHFREELLVLMLVVRKPSTSGVDPWKEEKGAV